MKKTKAHRTHVYPGGAKQKWILNSSSPIPAAVILTTSIMLCNESQQIGGEKTERRKTLAP